MPRSSTDPRVPTAGKDPPRSLLSPLSPPHQPTSLERTRMVWVVQGTLQSTPGGAYALLCRILCRADPSLSLVLAQTGPKASPAPPRTTSVPRASTASAEQAASVRPRKQARRNPDRRRGNGRTTSGSRVWPCRRRGWRSSRREGTSGCLCVREALLSGDSRRCRGLTDLKERVGLAGRPPRAADEQPPILSHRLRAQAVPPDARRRRPDRVGAGERRSDGGSAGR